MAETAIEVSPDWCAWAAGIIDGEGCIQLVPYQSKRRGTTWQIRLTVGNTDPRMLTKMQSLFGGAVSGQGNTKGSSARPMWAWNVACRQAEIVLRQIFPWLVVKKEQAEIALESRKLLRLDGSKEKFSPQEQLRFRELAGRMKSLKRQSFAEAG